MDETDLTIFWSFKDPELRVRIFLPENQQIKMNSTRESGQFAAKSTTEASAILWIKENP